MEFHADKLGCEQLTEEDRVVLTDQEDVLVEEFAEGLLREVKGAERLVVHKLCHTVYWFVFMFGFLRNIFASDQIDL